MRFAMLVCGLMCAATAVGASGEPDRSEAAAVASYFSSDDSLTRVMGATQFDEKVALPNRLEALSQAWTYSISQEKGNLIRKSIMAYLLDRKLKWFDHAVLESQVLSCASDSDPGVRQRVLNLIKLYAPAQGKPLSFVFLGDSDDSIRESALVLCGKLECFDVIRTYVRQHDEDKAFKESVGIAKRLIKAQEQKASSSGPSAPLP